MLSWVKRKPRKRQRANGKRLKGKGRSIRNVPFFFHPYPPPHPRVLISGTHLIPFQGSNESLPPSPRSSSFKQKPTKPLRESLALRVYPAIVKNLVESALSPSSCQQLNILRISKLPRSKNIKNKIFGLPEGQRLCKPCQNFDGEALVPDINYNPHIGGLGG